MFSVNQEAVRIVKEKIIPYAEQLNCKVIKLKNGATVVDINWKCLVVTLLVSFYRTTIGVLVMWTWHLFADI